MSRTIFLGANWKMHEVPAGALLAVSPFRSRNNLTIAVFPTALDIAASVKAGLTVGAQHGRAENNGAFTGSISIAMCKERGCSYVLCGHSEQRIHHGEKDIEICKQLEEAGLLGITPILCIGETQQEHKAQSTEAVLRRQLPAELPPTTIVAYEPCWAIGNGNTASCDDIASVHKCIRAMVGANHKILYGGSVNGENAQKILALPNVDGLLIGSASLDTKAFERIVQAAEKVL